MNTEQKIEAAYQRIKELQLLISYWESSKKSSQHFDLKLIEGFISKDGESDAA